MGWLSREKVIGAGMPNGVYLGRYRDPETNAPGPEIWLPWLEMVLIIGRNRSGKDAGILIPNALKREKNLSVSEVFVDTRLEAGTICAPYRRNLGPTLVGNAFNEHASLAGYADLRSDRLNLMKSPAFDPGDPLYFDHISELAAALFPAEGGDNNPFFPLSSQALWAGLTMAELQEAKREGRDPSMLNIRLAATEADQMDPTTGEPVAGLTARVRRLIDEGDPQICSLLGAFAGKQSDGIRDVIATTAAYTRWMLSKAIEEDEKSPRIDLAQLGKEPTTLFFGLPHKFHKKSCGLFTGGYYSNNATAFRAACGAGADLAQRVLRDGPGSGGGIRNRPRRRQRHSISYCGPEPGTTQATIWRRLGGIFRPGWCGSARGQRRRRFQCGVSFSP